MSKEPTDATWFPSILDAEQVQICAHVIIEVARQAGFTRETYAAAIAQLSEAMVGLDSADDIDAEVLRFVGERFRAASDAIARSGH